MLSIAPVLASPMRKEPMLLYIAATNRVVSAVVVVEQEEGGKTMQRPVNYLSEVLSTSKQNYPHYQKMIYGVYMAAKKLKHYFQEHPIWVVAEAPISEIISVGPPRDLCYIEMLCVLVTLAMSDTGVTSPRPEHHRQAGRN
jgi:hypothetical protein